MSKKEEPYAMTNLSTPLLVLPCAHSGYVVKEFAPLAGNTDLLFAGSLQECANFVVEWMSGKGAARLSERREAPPCRT